jgi:ABC-type multidrug transport system permease subunit
MRFAWASAWKDLQRHRRDPVGVLMWIGIPLIVGGLIILAFGGEDGVRPQAHLLVADEDESFLSGLLVGALSQEALGGFVRAEHIEQTDGRARMKKGDATALLVIPDGFGAAVLREEPMALRLLTNPSQRVLPGIVQEGLSVLVDSAFYLQRLIGSDLRALAEGPPPGRNTFPDSLVGALGLRANQLAERVAQHLNPLAIRFEVEASSAGDQDETGNLALYFLPGILFMSLLFMAQGLAGDLWRERTDRTLRRVVVSPQRIAAFLAGKAISAALLMATASVLAIVAGALFVGVPIATMPLAVVWGMFSGAALLGGMMLIQLHARSQRAGSVITFALTFPLMMIGGSFFPFEIMPKTLATIGRLTPNGWALQQMKTIVAREAEPGSLALAFGGLVVVGAVLFALSGRRLRSGFAQG